VTTLPASPTPASQWNRGAREAALVTLPSGNKALLKQITPEQLLSTGMIPNKLMPIVSDSISRAQGGKEVDAEALGQEVLADPEKAAQMMELFDVVAIACVVDPSVQPKPELGTPRDPELLYVDQMELEDKMFILQYAMEGTEDVERFRQELEGNVDTRSNRKPVARKAKQPAKRK
jgi:hypothetical protein